jgi:hypothetical protein
VPTPSLPRQYLFDSITAVGRDDAWLTGNTPTAAAGKNITAVIEHWNGRSWSVTPADLPSGNVSLGNVSAAGSSRLWAVGQRRDAGPSFVLRWTGTGWHRTDLPAASGLSAVVALKSGDVWAVGNGSAAHTRCR